MQTKAELEARVSELESMVIELSVFLGQAAKKLSKLSAEYYNKADDISKDVNDSKEKR